MQVCADFRVSCAVTMLNSYWPALLVSKVHFTILKTFTDFKNKCRELHGSTSHLRGLWTFGGSGAAV